MPATPDPHVIATASAPRLIASGAGGTAVPPAGAFPSSPQHGHSGNAALPAEAGPAPCASGLAITAAIVPSRLLMGAWAGMLAALGYTGAWAAQADLAWAAALAAAALCALLARPPLPPVSTLTVTAAGRIVFTLRQAKNSGKPGWHLHAKAWSPTVPCAIVTQNYTGWLMPDSKLGAGWLLLHLQTGAGVPMYVPILPDSVDRATMRGLIVALLASEKWHSRQRRAGPRRTSGPETMNSDKKLKQK